MLVPLTFVEKGVMRQFDMQGQEGESLPVLGRGEDLPLMRGVLLRELQPAVLDGARDHVGDALDRVIDRDPVEAAPIVEELVNTGRYRGGDVLDPRLISSWATELLRRVGACYLLVVLVPAEKAGTRMVIKYSHHWPFGPARPRLRLVLSLIHI